MEDNYEIQIKFGEDGQVTVSNLPNEVKSQKYTFTSINEKKYDREDGEKNLKIKVFYEGLNVYKKIKLQWKGQEVIYIHQDVNSLEDYQNIENSTEYKNYTIYFVKQGTPVKKELLENLVNEIGYKELIDEILKLKKDIYNLKNESQL